ncbi:MAG: holo-ACP synthase [Armatimonadota bacterium]|nr:holo-ACP synthase [Armatimonadota bacterium]MDR5697850.1 holo-ACP synthase [Armatimonadota bacterium]
MGVGVDIVEVARVERALHRWGEAFQRRVFTEAEWEGAGAGRARARRLAGRFAAKEAVMKALGWGWGRIGWHDIEVTNEHGGRPAARLSGAAAQLAKRAGVVRLHVSVSHGELYATAMAVAEGEA